MPVRPGRGILGGMIRLLVLAIAALAVSGCIDSRAMDAWLCEKRGVQPKTEQMDACVERRQRERDQWMERRIRANEMTSEA